MNKWQTSALVVYIIMIAAIFIQVNILQIRVDELSESVQAIETDLADLDKRLDELHDTLSDIVDMLDY